MKLTSRHVGLLLLALLLSYAFLLPLFHHGDPLQQELLNMLQPPSQANLLGFDHLGRDMLPRLSAALRLSLGLAALCVVSAMLVGVLAGVVSALYGGVLDRVVSMLGDMCLALPGLLLVLLLAAIAPDSPEMLWLGISLVLWVEFFRVTRATLRPIVHSPGMQASKLLGFTRSTAFTVTFGRHSHLYCLPLHCSRLAAPSWPCRRWDLSASVSVHPHRNWV